MKQAFLGCSVVSYKSSLLGCFVIDVKQAFLGYSVVSCKSSFLDCFVINVAIILFNRKGFVIFTWWNLFLIIIIFYFIYIFCLLILLMHIFFALPPPFLEQPSIQRCAPCCESCDHLKNASFETYDLRRSWRAVVQSWTHRDSRASISLSRLVRGPRRSYGYT